MRNGAQSIAKYSEMERNIVPLILGQPSLIFVMIFTKVVTKLYEICRLRIEKYSCERGRNIVPLTPGHPWESNTSPGCLKTWQQAYKGIQTTKLLTFLPKFPYF